MARGDRVTERRRAARGPIRPVLERVRGGARPAQPREGQGPGGVHDPERGVRVRRLGPHGRAPVPLRGVGESGLDSFFAYLRVVESADDSPIVGGVPATYSAIAGGVPATYSAIAGTK